MMPLAAASSFAEHFTTEFWEANFDANAVAKPAKMNMYLPSTPVLAFSNWVTFSCCGRTNIMLLSIALSFDRDDGSFAIVSVHIVLSSVVAAEKIFEI